MASDEGFHEEVLIAGFGGQGIILAGKLLAQTAMYCGKEVTYMPAYGAEVRGGTSNCGVIIADEPIACPVINMPDSLIIMNKASLVKFTPRLKEDGLLVMNSSLIDDTSEDLPKSIRAVSVPADDLAAELGKPKIANMVVLGAYLQKRQILSIEDAVKCLPNVLAKRHHHMLEMNTKALYRGAEFATRFVLNH